MMLCRSSTYWASPFQPRWMRGQDVGIGVYLCSFRRARMRRRARSIGVGRERDQGYKARKQRAAVGSRSFRLGAASVGQSRHSPIAFSDRFQSSARLEGTVPALPALTPAERRKPCKAPVFSSMARSRSTAGTFREVASASPAWIIPRYRSS